MHHQGCNAKLYVAVGWSAVSLVPRPLLRGEGERAWYIPTAHARVHTQNLGTSYISVKYSVK